MFLPLRGLLRSPVTFRFPCRLCPELLLWRAPRLVGDGWEYSKIHTRQPCSIITLRLSKPYPVTSACAWVTSDRTATTRFCGQTPILPFPRFVQRRRTTAQPFHRAELQSKLPMEQSTSPAGSH